ncbi:MAG TPA: hypothetical protein VGG75_13750 [Trebonia sp.]|jgi:hypothetical protein
MLGRIAYDAARWQVRAYNKSRKQPGGPWTFTAVLFCILPMTMLWMAVTAIQGSAVFWPLLGANAVMTWLVLVSAGFFTRRSYARQAERRYAPRPGITPEVLRARAAELRELAALRVEAGRGEVTEAEPTAAWQSGPGIAELPGELPDELERMRRMAALLAVACPENPCRAPETVPCIMGIGLPFIIVDREKIRFCHVERALEAVRSGTADADEVLAQFGLEGAA